jgi:nucleoside-diphosphate-sugar epimerase
VRIVVAGASGVIGRRLLPLLVGAGHEVIGTTRSLQHARIVEALGGRPLVVDVLDRGHLAQVLGTERPEVVIHELTELPKEIDPRKAREQLAATNRLRTEGTRNLVDGALVAGARRIVAQSYAHVYAPTGDWVKSEGDPLDLDAHGRSTFGNVEAIATLERTVLTTPRIEGVALRYGTFYGPGTAFAADGSVAVIVRQGGYPIAGDGRGVTSFVHVDDAAAATVLALEGPTGLYNICDDEPAPVSEWLPFYARTLGAPPPRHVPAAVARFIAGQYFVSLSTRQRGAANAKAKRELGFTLRYTTWREGFERERLRAAA